MSINVAKWTFFLSLCASRITSVLLFTLYRCLAGVVSSCFWSLSTATFTSDCILCLRCDLHNLSEEMIPNGFLLIHELPRCSHALFLESG